MSFLFHIAAMSCYVLILVIFFYEINYVQACSPIADLDGDGKQVHERGSLKIKFGRPGQWAPHAHQIEEWKTYLAKIKEHYNMIFLNPKGISGFPPPPWAKFANGYGKPDYCYLPPAPGNCMNLLLRVLEQRWGYNAFKDECEVFNYTGCHGNANKFMTKSICEQDCKKTPKTCCVAGIAALNNKNKG